MDEGKRGLGFWLARPWRLMFTMKGRSPRREYFLFVIQYYAALLCVALGVGFSAEWLNPKRDQVAWGIILIGFLLFFFVMFAPVVTACVRRLHDSGKSGLLGLTAFIPGVGGLILLLLLLLPGDAGENDYGPDPRETDWSPRHAQDIFG